MIAAASSFPARTAGRTLNLYDYAMGFEVLDFDGRYLRLPLYAMRSSWAPALNKHTVPDEELLARKNSATLW